LATIGDVADLAGVSNSTVSRVLNNKEYVKESTRNKVYDAVEKLGYKPSRVARSLRVNSSQIIGLIISDIQNPFFTSLVRAVEDVAYANNHAIILSNTDEDPQREQLNVDLMISERVAGVIMTPSSEINCPVQKLLKLDIPVVCVDRQVTDCETDTVVSNNVASSFELISYLIELGHRRIGAVLAPSNITTGRERLEGYKKAHHESGIYLDTNLIKQDDPKRRIGYDLANKLLDLKDPPTAIFAGNNLLALGTFQAINERGLKIPEDISLVSFDNREWTQLVSPKITVVSQPTYEMGKKAAELVLSRINNSDSEITKITLESKLLFRDSVKPFVRNKEVVGNN